MNNLGELKRTVELYEESLNWYKQAAKIYPNNPFTHYYTGLTNYDMGNYSEAENQFKIAIEILPDFSFAFNDLALLYMEQEKYDQAITTFRKGIKYRPSSQWNHHDLAIAYKNCGMFDEAIAEFKLAGQIDSRSRYHYLGIATVYIEQGDYDNAIKVYQMTLSKFPNCLYTALNYSFALNLKGDESNARRTLENFLEVAKIEHVGIGKCYTYIAQFYLGKMNENELINSINIENLKMKDKYTIRHLNYYIGMSYLLNLKNALDKQPKDTVKAIEHLQKYLSAERINNDIEYSLAKAELKKSTKLN